MALKLIELHGMTDDLAGKLKSQGLGNSDKLLAAVAQPKARAEMAATLGVSERALLELGNRADLARIRGVGKVFSDLLESAGVDTVAELATRKPENLYSKIVEVAPQHFVKRLPRPADVQNWVEQAKSLERAIWY
jgi:predicted flap endonuclease-1-like 5' DNA nuclease